MSPACTALLSADVAITLAAPGIYLHAMPAAAAEMVASWDESCLPIMVTAVIAVIWLLAVPVLWSSALNDAVDAIEASATARRHVGHETYGSSQLVR